jgi:hypothetical protein
MEVIYHRISFLVGERRGWERRLETGGGGGGGAGGMATQVRCCFGPLTKTTTRYRPFQKSSTSKCDMQKFWNWGAINNCLVFGATAQLGPRPPHC